MFLSFTGRTWWQDSISSGTHQAKGLKLYKRQLGGAAGILVEGDGHCGQGSTRFRVVLGPQHALLSKNGHTVCNDLSFRWPKFQTQSNIVS